MERCLLSVVVEEEPSLAQAREAAAKLGLANAGGLSPRDAWALVQAGEASLVDVRTVEANRFVGHVPGSVNVPWATGTALTRNPRFVRELEAKFGNKQAPCCCCAAAASARRWRPRRQPRRVSPTPSPRTLVLLAVVLNLPHLTYFILSQTMPTDMTWIGVPVAIKKFGFGMGSVGQMLYMMQQVAPGSVRMTHYAFATGVMALTKWSTGSASAYIWGLVGHDDTVFFTGVLIVSVIPVLLAWWAPFPHKPASATA